MHPEWQQKLVSSIISFLNHVAKGSSIHVIFASHSPILLSDIPIRNAIFLERKFDDEQLRRGSHTEQVYTENARLGYVNTFAANIIDLMGLSFFMKEGTIGFFSRKKIQDVLDGEIREEAVAPVLDLIGDPFICKIVKDSLES